MPASIFGYLDKKSQTIDYDCDHKLQNWMITKPEKLRVIPNTCNTSHRTTSGGSDLYLEYHVHHKTTNYVLPIVCHKLQVQVTIVKTLVDFLKQKM